MEPINPSSHNHGSWECVPPIVVTFQILPCSTSMSISIYWVKAWLIKIDNTWSTESIHDFVSNLLSQSMSRSSKSAATLWHEKSLQLRPSSGGGNGGSWESKDTWICGGGWKSRWTLWFSCCGILHENVVDSQNWKYHGFLWKPVYLCLEGCTN